MKRTPRILAILIVVAGLGAFGVSFLFGGLRVQRDATAYLEALETCRPFEQEAWTPILRSSLRRTVAGMQDGSCVVTMDAIGAGRIRCALDDDAKALMVDHVQDGAASVTFFGGQTVSLKYSSENPDPMTQLLNGPNCAIEN